MTQRKQAASTLLSLAQSYCKEVVQYNKIEELKFDELTELKKK